MSYNSLIQVDGKIVNNSDRNKVKHVVKNSPSYKHKIKVGERILSINGVVLKDILDYRFLGADETVVLEVMDTENNVRKVTIHKDTYEDLGIEFESGIIDKASSCSNQCIFCFIDQLPKGMRETLYFKDDDSRLSFLQGNFVTLTNMTKSDIDRIINYRISPINVSVHTTNPELRVKMLGNRNAGKVFDTMKRLAENRITMNAQIVLVPDWNDKLELDRTLRDLFSLYPGVENVAIVPLGMTKHRENLIKLNPFDKDRANEVIEQVDKLQEEFLKEKGVRFARCADEFYVMAQLDVPDEDFYEGYEQLEDGIGMIRLFRESVNYTLEDLKKGSGEFTFITGESAYPEIEKAAKLINHTNKRIKTNAYKIENEFFGKSITVAGLLTGTDILNKLGEKEVYSNLIMPRNMFRADDTVMLDDIDKKELEERLNTRVIIVDYTGEDLIERINENLVQEVI